MVRGRQTRRIPDWMIGPAITCVVLGTAGVWPAFLESLGSQACNLRLRRSGSRAPAQHIAIVASRFQSTTSAPPPIMDFVPKLQPILHALADTALSKDPAPRFQTGSASPGAATTVGQRAAEPGRTAAQQSKA